MSDQETEGQQETHTKPERGGQRARRVRVPGFIGEDEIGLGDAIKRLTSSLGIRPCTGCERRAAALNRRVVLYGRHARGR